MTPRTLLAVFIGKTVNFILKTSGRGATAAPGYYALKVDPNLLEHLAANLDQVILVTGTNGKTTTSRFIATILEKAGVEIIHNKAGSNLLRGLVSTLIQDYPLKSGLTAIFEVDEAVLPLVLDHLTPDYLLVNNLFRDQLDRYGEVSAIQKLWKEAIKKLPESTTVLLNSDDPNIADLGREVAAQVVFFGLEDTKLTTKIPPHTIDARVCPLDGNPLEYEAFYLAHLGIYRCSSGDFTRPAPTISGERIALRGLNSASFTINFSGPEFEINLPLSGIYNIYNSLAAASLTHEMGISNSLVKSGLESPLNVFGRQQTLQVGEKKVVLNLVKNPVGFNEVLRILTTQKDLNLLFFLNDKLADGTDVSWIWDVDFETLEGKIKSVVVSGTRGAELANRLKYASVFDSEVKVEDDKERALERALTNTKEGETLFVLPTYTAMLSLQKLISSKGMTKSFWE